MNIDISICTILRGESHTREKSIAYEFFINDTISYQEAFIPSKNQQVGNYVRAELVAIRKALDVCVKELDCAAKINLLIQQKDTLSLIDIDNSSELNRLSSNDLKHIENIKKKQDHLHSIGCEINYINKECKDSTNELAESRLSNNIKDDIIVNNIKSTLSNALLNDFMDDILNKDTSEVSITDEILDKVLDEPKLKICNVKQTDQMTTNQLVTNINNENIYKITNEIQSILDEEVRLNEAILEAKHKLSYLKAYNSSIKNLNSTICDENNKLESDINKLNDNIAIVSTEVDAKKANVSKSSEDINILRREINSIKREISNIKERDILLIQYLKNQIERLVLEVNLPFVR